MKIFDFVCVAHPEDIVTVEAATLSAVLKEQRSCAHCGQLMERFFGESSPTFVCSGPNWPKRDIRERAFRLRQSEDLKKRQKKVWGDRMPKLNLDPDLQKEVQQEVLKSGSPWGVQKR